MDFEVEGGNEVAHEARRRLGECPLGILGEIRYSEGDSGGFWGCFSHFVFEIGSDSKGVKIGCLHGFVFFFVHELVKHAACS